MATVLFPPDWASPGAIGSTTPNTVATTQISGPPDAVGTNAAGTDLVINGSRGTGAANGGGFVFRYSGNAGVSGATPNNLANAFTISPNGNAGGAVGSTANFTFSFPNWGQGLVNFTSIGGGLAAVFCRNSVPCLGVGYTSGSSTHVVMGSECEFGFAAAGIISTSSLPDTFLRRNSSGVFLQRNGTNPQGFLWANTWTSSTNNELGYTRWASNEFRIGTEKGSGGGTARGLALQTDGVTRLAISATGQATFSAGVATAIVTLTDGATIATNLALSNSFEVTIAGNRTLSNPTNLINGGTVNWVVIASGGTRTLTLDTAFVLPDGTATPLSIADGKMLVLSGVCRNNKVYVQNSGIFTP